MPEAAARTVTLAGETDFDGFRRAARTLLGAGVGPDAVAWAVRGSAAPGLFDDGPAAMAADTSAPPLAVPAGFVQTCRDAALHADRGRFALLYRLLWRLQHEPALRHDALDAEMAQARRLAHAVTHEIHQMHAFVRFRPAGGLHVAWFEPTHHIVEAAAPFFARRFANMPWAILTPGRSVRWHGERLEFGPGAERAAAPPADAGETLWLTYYESIFNPARLKLAAMAREMPRRYWPNLPEAARIGVLAAQAAQRSGTMLARAPQPTARRLPVPAMSRAATLAPPPPLGDRAAREAAWQAERERALHCQECPLFALGTQTVWGEGPVGAALMLVGEQPGDQEDLQGRPFVGPAGGLLTKAMAELDWERSRVYVTNAVKHFKWVPAPRGKRRIHKTPSQREADACEHWLESEIALVQPQALVALGAIAARQLLGRPVAVTKERGHWLARADGRRVLVTLHPSALLRSLPEERELAYAAWLRDLKHASRFVHAPVKA